MQTSVPKQYLKIGGRTLIEHSLACFDQHPLIDAVVVALADQDPYWPRLEAKWAKPLHTVAGGATRSHSVLNALQFIQQSCPLDTWILVHDAARPCLEQTDLDRLLTTLRSHPVGGLLAAPVRDTLKRSNDHLECLETVDRTHLWHALTPQMFRLGLLHKALELQIAQGMLATDDASAIEQAGYTPQLVSGSISNIKVTQPEDLMIAQRFIEQRQKNSRPLV